MNRTEPPCIWQPSKVFPYRRNEKTKADRWNVEMPECTVVSLKLARKYTYSYSSIRLHVVTWGGQMQECSGFAQVGDAATACSPHRLGVIDIIPSPTIHSPLWPRVAMVPTIYPPWTWASMCIIRMREHAGWWLLRGGGERFGGKTGDDRRRLDLGLLAFDSYLLSIIYFKWEKKSDQGNRWIDR